MKNMFSNNQRASLLLIGGSIWFTFMMVLFKSLVLLYPFEQVIFMQSFAASLCCGILIIYTKKSFFFKKKLLPIYTLRSGLAACAITCWFYSISNLELFVANAIGYTRNIFLILMGIFILKEAFSRNLVFCTFFAFIGVLLAIDPLSAKSKDLHFFGVFFAIIGALIGALLTLVIKNIPTNETILRISFYPLLCVTMIYSYPAYSSWIDLNLNYLILFSILGAVTLIGQLSFISSYRDGDISLMAIAEYSRVLFIGLAGYWFFLEVPSFLSLFGIALLMASITWSFILSGVKKNDN